MNDSETCCIWTRRIRRMHWFGISAMLTMATFVWVLRGYPEQTWTAIVPVLKSPPYDQRYSAEDLQHWVSTRGTIPLQQAKLKSLRNQIAIETVGLRRWVSDFEEDPIESSSTKRTLRNIAEEMHQKASQSQLVVKMIRIESFDRIPNSEVTHGDSSVSFKWHPITLRVEGSYQQACRFLHQLSEEHPAQCRRLKWTSPTEGSSKFQLELVLAFAIAGENSLFESNVESKGAHEA